MINSPGVLHLKNIRYFMQFLFWKTPWIQSYLLSSLSQSFSTMFEAGLTFIDCITVIHNNTASLLLKKVFLTLSYRFMKERALALLLLSVKCFLHTLFQCLKLPNPQAERCNALMISTIIISKKPMISSINSIKS